MLLTQTIRSSPPLCLLMTTLAGPGWTRLLLRLRLPRRLRMLRLLLLPLRWLLLLPLRWLLLLQLPRLLRLLLRLLRLPRLLRLQLKQRATKRALGSITTSLQHPQQQQLYQRRQ